MPRPPSQGSPAMTQASHRALRPLCRARLFSAVHCALWVAGGLFAGSAAAQETEAAPAQDSEARTLETVSVLGSRRSQRSSDTTSISPVDVLPMAKNTEEGAQFDLAQSLQYAAPSFNSTRQS